MKLIVETDLGGDADDFFALLYLISAGVDIKAIILSPGYKDQVAIARFICKELGIDVPIGSGRPDSPKTAERGFHHKIMDKCGYKKRVEDSDGLGSMLIKTILNKDPDCEFFGCGPLLSMGEYLNSISTQPELKLPQRATMQGGFLSYNYYKPNIFVERFLGKLTCPSFNMNGNKEGIIRFINASIPERRFVGKNVCHTLVYDKGVHQKVINSATKNDAQALFKKSMTMFVAIYGDKKFHDPFAAVCHLHPEIATWLQGKPYCVKGEWGVNIGGGQDYIVADVDRELFWKHIVEGN